MAPRAGSSTTGNIAVDILARFNILPSHKRELFMGFFSEFDADNDGTLALDELISCTRQLSEDSVSTKEVQCVAIRRGSLHARA